MKFNQAAWSRQQAEIKSDFESYASRRRGVYISCGTGLHDLSSRYMVMGVEIDCLTSLIEVDEAKAKE